MLDVVTLNDLWQNDIDGWLPVLMDIYNPDIVWTDEEKEAYGQDDSYIRVIADDNQVVYNGHTYLPCAFTYTPPEVDGKKVGTASISITALDARVKRILRTIKIPSEVTVVSMFAKVTRESGSPIYKYRKLNSKPFMMNSASSNKTTATFNLVFGNNFGQNIPYDMATQDRVPGTGG
jgi:hypothetical protein